MTIHMRQPGLEGTATAVRRTQKNRYSPKMSLQEEVVAGFIWMNLNLPEDVSRTEIEAFARQIIAYILAGADEVAIESALVVFQNDQLCRPINQDVISRLVQRLRIAVRGS